MYPELISLDCSPSSSACLLIEPELPCEGATFSIESLCTLTSDLDKAERSNTSSSRGASPSQRQPAGLPEGPSITRGSGDDLFRHQSSSPLCLKTGATF